MTLSDHFSIHVLELKKWARTLAPEDDWIEFLRSARGWAELPAALSHNVELNEAMAILNEIAEVTDDFEIYQRRLARQRLDLTLQNRFDKAERRTKEAEEATAEERRLRLEEERKRIAAEAEIARLRALLAERDSEAK